VDKLKKTVKESLENFDKAIPDDLVRKQLEMEGVDLNEQSLSQDKFIKQLAFRLKSKSTVLKNDSMLDKASNYFKDALTKGLDKPIAYMNNLIQTNQLQTQFSRLEKMSEEQIKDIIKDQNLIEILEMLEEESEGQ
jgi:anionic cell wall polymer biosynthesis LytR-Cps2A-Psr (LCP) family protein